MDSMSWIRAQMTLMDAASAIVSFAANWLVQSTLLIAAGLAIGRLLRARGSAVQSAVYRTTLAAAIACPLATSLLAFFGVSGWSLEMPTAWTYEEFPAPVADDAATAAIDSQFSLPAAEPIADDEMRIAGASLPMDATSDAAVFAPHPPFGDLSPGVRAAEMADQLAPAGEPASNSPNVARQAASVRVPTAVFDVRLFGLAATGIALAWLAASAVLLARLLRAWRRLHRLRSAAAPAELAAQETCRELAALLNVSPPELLRSPYLASPCLAGLRRPAVLLPEFDPSLPVRDVLIHELAHLRRRDGHWNLLRRLAEAVLFYQPLLWLLARRLEAVAEEVCDDYVVHLGGDRERYARGLVEIAELSLVPAGAASVAMVSLRSILARRITRILDSSRLLSTRVGNLLLVVVIAAGLAGVMAAGFVGLGSQRSLAEAQASDDDAATADDIAGDATREEDKQVDKAAVAETRETPVADKEQANEPPVETKAAPANEVKGVVAGVNGKPVAGAKLYWLRSRVHDIDPQPPQLLATTDKDGRYQFVEPPPVPAESPASWEYMDRIVIVAPGHGFRFTSTEELRREWSGAEGLVPALAQALLGGRKGVTSLPPAGDPIRGRLVDVNGQPVAGAKVRIRWFADLKDRLDGIEEAKARGVENPVWQLRVDDLLNVIEPAPLRDALPSAVTDAAGNFELRDLGVGRLVQLLVEGDGIEATEIVARNQPGEKIVLDDDRNEAGRKLTVYPNEFLHAVGPSKPVTGRVFDLDSGQPIAGAMVRAFRVHGEQVSSSREREHFAVRTDAEGRYRITGLPVGKENELVAFATGETAYLAIGRDADTSAPGAELQLDFRLKRGAWAEGRVYDAETRKPFTGEISYYFFRDRKQEEAIPGLNEAYVDGLYWTNADGEFRVPVLPTRGILAFRYDGFNREGDGIDRFARGFGADKIAGSEDFGGAKAFPTAPHYVMPANYERIAEVPATDGQQTVRVDMPLFASPPIKVRVVDADGRPATRFQAYGANERWGWQNQDGPQFEIQDLRPGERRKVFVFQRERNLAGGAFVEYGAKEVVEIKLAKAGSIRGRLTDPDGEPIDDAALQVQYEKLRSDDNSGMWAPQPDATSSREAVRVDKGGRFHIEGLIPGWSYHAFASAPRKLNGQTVSFIIGAPFTGVEVEPGEEKDLGDVTAEDNKPNLNKDQAKDPSRSQEKSSQDGTAPQSTDKAAVDRAETTTNEIAGAERRQLHGRVVDEAGRPIAGARVRLLRIDTERTTWVDQGQVVAASKSEPDGTFAIDFPLGKPFATREEFISSSYVILADTENHVFDWQHVSPGEPEITLRLSAADLPIEGRVLDLEGRPIAGVRVGVNEISGGAENLDQWVEQAKRNPASLDESMMARPISARNPEQQPVVARYPGNKRLQPGLPSLLPAATTDENGSFRLAGLGRDRLVRLELAGAGIAKTWLNVVTRDMPAVPYPNQDPRFRVQTCFGRRFKFAAEPEQPITGVVRDADSGRPLAGAEVRLNQYADSLLFVEGFLSAKTDEQGRYALGGVPKPHDRERSHRLRIVPGADQPYFRTEFQVAKRDGFEPVQGDVKLKRARWLRGRAIDTATGQPIHGLVEYYPFLSNQAAADYANFEPGMHLMEGDRYVTDKDGNFQIPVLPGRGLLAFIALQADRYPAGDGLDEIADLRQQGDRNLNIYHLGSLDLATAFREVNPAPGAAEVVCDVQLKSLDVARVKLVDEQGRPVAGAVAQRLAPYRIGGSNHVGWPQQPLLAATAEIIGPRDQSRTAMFLHRERQLAAAILLTPERAPPETIVLHPAATLSGRIVDREGKPIGGLGMTVSAAPPPGAKPLPGWVRESAYYTHQLAYARTGEDGAFRVEQVPPGVAYVIYARNGAKETTTRVVQPGEQLYLGDVVLEEPKADEKDQAKTPAKPGSTPKPPANGQEKPGARGDAPQKDEPAPAAKSRTGKPSQEAGRKTNATLRGRVTRDGRPASGANVAVIARKTAAVRGGDFGPRGDVLAEGKTDANGDYSLKFADAAAKSHAYANVIARQEGAAIAWQQLNLEAVDSKIDLELPAEDPVCVRLIDLEGQPAAGVRLTVRGIADSSKSGEASGVGYQGEKVPAAWLAPVVSDEQGRFVVHGVPAAHGLFMEVGQDERFAPLEIDLSPGANEQRGERDATYRPLVKKLKPGEEAVLTLSPAQPFAGTVRYADSGKPAPHARISIWASQQEPFGSMISVGGSADGQGRYRISPKPGIIFGLIAYPPDGVPYLARQTSRDEPLRWNASEGVKQVDLNLPRGVLVQGTIVEAGGNRPVAGAAIQYVPESSNNPIASNDVLTGWQAIQLSDEEGRFSIAVLPGPGRLLVSGQQGNYVLQQISELELSDGKPGGARSYAHAIAKLDPQVGQETLEVKLELQPGATASGRIVDEQGQAIEEATVISRLNISPYSLFWRGHTTPTLGGRFELTGLAKDAEYPVYFLDAKRRLGATEIIKAGEDERTVVLKPCGQARLRAVDKNGEPGADHVSVEMVVTPGVFRYDFEAVRSGQLAADADYIANIDRTNHWNRPQTDDQGTFILQALIPGASYRVITGRGGTLKVVKEFQVQSNESLDLGEILIERSE